MHRLLRKRDVDVQLPKTFDDFVAQIVTDGRTVEYVGGETVELKIETAVAEVGKDHRRRRRRQNIRVGSGNFKQRLFNLFDIAVVADADLDDHPAGLVAVGVVDQAF